MQEIATNDWSAMMPIESRDVVSPLGGRTGVSVCLEPVYNQLYSMVLLSKEERMPGVHEWVYRTRGQMSLEERQRHRLVTWGLYYTFASEASWPAFGTYIEHLASLSPQSFQDRLMISYSTLGPEGCRPVPPGLVPRTDWSGALSSADRYLAFLAEHFNAADLDLDLETQAYGYVIDPPAMKDLIVDHLRTMWDRYLAPEWTRVRPMVTQSVEAFRQVDLTGMARPEAVRTVIGRDLPDQHYESLVDEAEHVLLVPNAHIGSYLGKFISGTTLVLVFGARMPEGSRTEAADLGRTELLAHLGALSDENRLRILRMAAEGGEIRAPEVMASLDISQSAASRNLSQLTATGFLLERRHEGGKAYSLNVRRVDDTVRAIARFLRSPAPSATAGVTSPEGRDHA
jgi:DNA-binding transcriptional ArsR family regulator